jgi:adenine-specific DNA-methyltransferase
MGRLRYIGSKARIASVILEHAGSPTGGRFVDAFCGTGVISREAAVRGWPVLANDTLNSSVTITLAQMLNQHDVSFEALGGYFKAIQKLNECKPLEGFIFREYSPSGQSQSGHNRLYFTTENATKIDGARSQIKEWVTLRLVTEVEASLLIADLLEATNRVANIAGTYGCFLSKWSPSAKRVVELQPRKMLLNEARFETLCSDACKLKVKPEDLVYLDPPYTKRQYAAYYHLLETIAIGDSPTVGGVVGLRPWEAKASPFCYKGKALPALLTLATGIGAERVLISYNSQGHIQINDLAEALIAYGKVTLHALGEIGRYRPNEQSAANGGSVTEFLVEFVPGRPTKDVKVVAKPKENLELAL